MSALLVGLLAIVLALAIGFGASYYLHRIRQPREETAAGIAMLADIRWREFIHLVLQSLEQRGYELLPDDDDSDDLFMLKRDGQRWLLSSRHGGSAGLNPHAITEFAKDVQMQGADGGILVSPGRFSAEAMRQAQTHHVQLLDGPTLWPDLRSLLPIEQRAVAADAVQARIHQRAILGWVIAGVLGLGLALLYGRLSGEPDTVAAAPVAHTAARPPAANSAAKADDDAGVPAPTDPGQLLARRKEVIELVSTLPHVDRAVWSTQSTLLVYLLDDAADPVPSLCPILDHYAELRTSRIQLQPPQASGKRVRFLQCRTY